MLLQIIDDRTALGGGHPRDVGRVPAMALDMNAAGT
jgi:hypothetical protein